MKITAKSWKAYVEKLAKVNKKASTLMKQYIAEHGTEDNGALVQYAYSLASRYGEAAAELACQMYDELATASGAKVAAAIPAETATMSETAIAVNGSKMMSVELIPNAVERLVKMAGQDTTLQNAIRDRAEWAWVPSGDTCAFCLTLASNGWQRASKKALAGNHAQHIHANCDCAYMIRFNEDTEVDGYDPDEYMDMYADAEGLSTKEKVNYMRRQNYAKNKDIINAQKRAAYARRKEQSTIDEE